MVKCLICKKIITKDNLHISHKYKNKKEDFCSLKHYAEYLGVRFVIINTSSDLEPEGDEDIEGIGDFNE